MSLLGGEIYAVKQVENFAAHLKQSPLTKFRDLEGSFNRHIHDSETRPS